jgi:hypothetical protein
MKAVVKYKKMRFTVTTKGGLKVTGPKGFDTAPLVEYLQTAYRMDYSPALGFAVGFYAERLAALLDGKVASVELGEEPEGMIY